MDTAAAENTETGPADERRWARALVERGDEAAFRQLYRRYTPRLYGFSLRLLGREADAEDVVQDTWTLAVRKLDGFRWESRFDTWLTGIAHNLCRECLRKRPREERSLDETPGEAEDARVWPASSSNGHRPTGDLRLDLSRAIARLADGYRTVLVLHDLEGLTHQEIGDRLGIAVGTSKSQLFEARKRIKTWLKGARHGTS